MAWHRKFQKSSPTQLLGNEQLCFFQPSNWMQPVGTETNLVNRINWSATTSDVWEKMINHMCPLGLSDPERCLLCWVSNSFSRGYFSACYGLVPRAASWRARSSQLTIGSGRSRDGCKTWVNLPGCNFLNDTWVFHGKLTIGNSMSFLIQHELWLGLVDTDSEIEVLL